MIPHDDRGLLLGDGLFETLLAMDGRIARMDAHLDRMAVGCEALGLPFDRDEAQRRLREAVPAAGRFALRLTLTAGSGGRGLDRPEATAPRLIATAAPAAAPVGAASLIIARTRRNEGSPAARHKTLSYLDNVLARREARAAGADEAVMLNNRGEAACASAANLFWIRGEALFTPDLACGVLAGITRARLLALAPVQTAVAGVEALREADAIFLTNSLIGVRPVGRLEDRVLPPHPRVAALAKALAADPFGVAL